MRGLDAEVLPVGIVDPFGTFPVTWEYKRVDNSIIVEDADFELPV